MALYLDFWKFQFKRSGILWHIHWRSNRNCVRFSWDLCRHKEKYVLNPDIKKNTCTCMSYIPTFQHFYTNCALMTFSIQIFCYIFVLSDVLLQLHKFKVQPYNNYWRKLFSIFLIGRHWTCREYDVQSLWSHDHVY